MNSSNNWAIAGYNATEFLKKQKWPIARDFIKILKDYIIFRYIK